MALQHKNHTEMKWEKTNFTKQVPYLLKVVKQKVNLASSILKQNEENAIVIREKTKNKFGYWCISGRKNIKLI